VLCRVALCRLSFWPLMLVNDVVAQEPAHTLWRYRNSGWLCRTSPQ